MSQRRIIFLFFVVVVGLAAVIFYLNRSKTVDLKEVIKSQEFINEIINNTWNQLGSSRFIPHTQEKKQKRAILKMDLNSIRFLS